MNFLNLYFNESLWLTDYVCIKCFVKLMYTVKWSRVGGFKYTTYSNSFACCIVIETKERK